MQTTPTPGSSSPHWREGYYDGLNNVRPMRNPYVEFSPAWVEYDRGYDFGQQVYETFSEEDQTPK